MDLRAPPSPPRLTSAPRLGALGLCVLLSGQFLPMVDFSVVNVSLSAVSRSLHATATELELYVAVYGVAFAAFLAIGGRLGDRLGRRLLFTVGVSLFGLASLLCGVAPAVWFLLGARVLQGLAAGLLVPQILASIQVGLAGRAHSRAIGLYGAMGGLAFVAGQVLGGLLVAADVAGLGWRSVFLVNLPVCGLTLLGSRAVPETRAPQAAAADLPGTVLLTSAIVALLLPLSLGPARGWTWPCLSPLVAVPALLAALWHVERGAAHPLLPPALVRLPAVRFALLVGSLFFSCWSGFMFATALALQAGAGMSAARSGTAFVALGASFFLGSLLTPHAVGRLGSARALAIGAAIQMTGLAGLLLVLQRTWPGTGVLQLAPATVLVGFGQAFIVSCYLRIGLAEVPACQAGVGSAMLATVQQAAMGLGPALLGALYLQGLRATGSSLVGVSAAIGAELLVMLALASCALLWQRRRARPDATAPAGPGDGQNAARTTTPGPGARRSVTGARPTAPAR